MTKTAENIKEEMVKRGLMPNTTTDLLLGGLMLSLEELVASVKK